MTALVSLSETLLSKCFSPPRSDWILQREQKLDVVLEYRFDAEVVAFTGCIILLGRWKVSE